MTGPLRIRLEEERRNDVGESLRRFLVQEFELELSPFQTDRLIDWLLTQLGAPVYNQAIQDARAFFQDKLIDLEGEFYEPEDPRARS